MSNFSDALAGAARSGVCALLGIPSYVADMLERINFFPFDSARRAIPDFWRNMLCDRDAAPPNPPPYTGGQCQAVYFVTGTLVRRFNSTGNLITETGSAQVPGPLGAPTTRQTGPSNLEVGIIDGNGTFRGLGGINTDLNTLVSWNIDSVVRVDGLPDNCGDPTPVYPPLTPGDVTINTDITYENSDGLDITVPIVLVYARASIDARANITIPVTVNINGTLNVTGTVNLDGTVNFNFGSAGGGGSPKDPRKDPCDDISQPDGEVPEDPTDSEQPSQPDREREQVIKGVLVTVTSLSNERASLLVQNDNPDIYVPNLGFVQFLCRVGQTQGGWTTDLPVKNRRHVIQCPWDEGAVAVRGTPQPGVTWVLTPLYGYAGIPVEYVE